VKRERRGFFYRAQRARAKFKRQPQQACDTRDQNVRQQKITEPLVAGEHEDPPQRERRVE